MLVLGYPTSYDIACAFKWINTIRNQEGTLQLRPTQSGLSAPLRPSLCYHSRRRWDGEEALRGGYVVNLRTPSFLRPPVRQWRKIGAVYDFSLWQHCLSKMDWLFPRQRFAISYSAPFPGLIRLAVFSRSSSNYYMMQPPLKPCLQTIDVSSYMFHAWRRVACHIWSTHRS